MTKAMKAKAAAPAAKPKAMKAKKAAKASSRGDRTKEIQRQKEKRRIFGRTDRRGPSSARGDRTKEIQRQKEKWATYGRRLKKRPSSARGDRSKEMQRQQERRQRQAETTCSGVSLPLGVNPPLAALDRPQYRWKRIQQCWTKCNPDGTVMYPIEAYPTCEYDRSDDELP